MNLLEGMMARDQDEFRRICNKLINICFLCKQNETTRTDYYFILRYREKFDDFLGVLGYRLEINEEYGVVQLVNGSDVNRRNLKLYESIILLILRILFDEKKRELSVSDEVIVNLGDIQDKFMSLKIRDKMIDKTTMRNTLRVLKRYQLIELLDRDMGNEESRILIYDSILMAVRVEDIKSVYEKIAGYRKGTSENEETD
ncbi:MAG: DUF4194 domain-containing protein [Eubacteriaceae bacterium]|nr:DUF4194 domain-containing protein [Eubacteriaceae bacterium]